MTDESPPAAPETPAAPFYCTTCGAAVESAQVDLSAVRPSGRVSASSPPRLSPCGHSAVPKTLGALPEAAWPDGQQSAIDNLRLALLRDGDGGLRVSRVDLAIVVALADQFLVLVAPLAQSTGHDE